MSRLSHRQAPRPTVQALIVSTARRLSGARLHYGHGTDNARDDAAALVLHAMRRAGQLPAAALARRVPEAARVRLEALLQRRIRERVPVVYLTQRCWFAGLPMFVDERVLIPRSPIAELIERRFVPWVQPERVRRILDLGTGSGCIAIACARAFPRARVDATDVSTAALAVARINIARHRLQRRVRARNADLFTGIKAARYDMIVSNPPYVREGELQGLPAEYRHEPRLALAAGRDGLDAVRGILRDAAAHLNEAGILIVEVGDTERALRRAFPRVPFLWLAFRRGGGGVFLLSREQLVAHAAGLTSR
ncbi:MAG TPA: 50S ribosomal protein L3 N(5)-glutamine methyltransferase [Steroidobacteraceae bacterium]|nr:50S ribosomal protein L3 N(5)-glutamine methyltransferase [Steroidobacteraceae bacterium]